LLHEKIDLAEHSALTMFTDEMFMQWCSFARRSSVLFFVAGLGLAGCTSSPPVHLSGGETRDELAGHIRYLSQPALKGRKTRSAGARLARHYIEERFRADGLVPWGKETSYEISFRVGKNVVGVLPGSDTNLVGEIVMLLAHYDHLGKDRKGRIYPGASDNASGVAALLEAARRLSEAGHRPKRTVAFAAFDGEEEMLLGSCAFSTRPDVEQAKIVGIVNVDMLGRDFLDTVTNTVFAAGTEGYPALEKRVMELGTEAGIRVLPIGTDFIGPRSDHAPFESRDIPCVFFSCGTFGDYHKPGDTAGKINYTNVEHSARVILATMEELANANAYQPAPSSTCDREELESVRAVISDLSRDPQKAGIKAKDVEKLHSLQRSIEKLADGGTYDRRTREQFIIEASGSLLPYLLPFGEDEAAQKDNQDLLRAMPYLVHVYLNYHKEIMDGQKQLVAELVKHPPAALLLSGMPSFRYEVYGISDDDIHVAQTRPGRFALNVLADRVTLVLQGKPLLWPFGGSGGCLTCAFEPLDCEGSREQLTDLCLLRLHADPTNRASLQGMKKVLRAVNGQEPQGGYKEWLQARLNQEGYKKETDWLLSCIASGNPELAREAIGAAHDCKDPRVPQAVREVLRDRNVRADVRAEAMRLEARRRDKAALLALTEVLDDSSPVYKREFSAPFRPDYPLTNSMIYRTVLPLVEKYYSEQNKTIGQTALENLKKLTKKNFGADAEKWRDWVRHSG
jgi:hypothetical protein